jgi:hypothetical protein
VEDQNAVKRSQVSSDGNASLEQLEPSVRVVRVVLRDCKDLSETGVVCRHHLLLGLPLGHEDELLDVLDRAEGLGPEAQVTGNPELLKPFLGSCESCELCESTFF